jgi:hypothetical protein
MDMMRGMGLGLLADQLADLKLGELLSTPPPGLDEAAALAKVVQFAQSADYARFSRIVIDTAPTGGPLCGRSCCVGGSVVAASLCRLAMHTVLGVAAGGLASPLPLLASSMRLPPSTYAPRLPLPLT